ncbi:lipocalin-like domain-containing protein [soil metagenome]
MTHRSGQANPRLVGVLGLVVVAVLLVWGAVRMAAPPERREVRATLSAAEALAGGDTAGYARALEPREFIFPDDHGPHPDYRTEWWYLTGHLDAADGRSFGFQLTFFRNALSPGAPERTSAWSTNQLWMGHFAITEVETGRHVYEERFARGAAGLAGATADPFRVWIEGWELDGERPGDAFPFRMRAAMASGEALDREVTEGKPPVLQGDAGLSQKGPEPGNASYYLSWTRMPLRGTVTLDGEPVTVSGEGWMDREWSTSALGEVHRGWDWFSLQLDDGRELMFFELRRADGTPDPLNHGALVAADGSVLRLGGDQVSIDVLEQWRSPLDGTEYPSGWRLRIPEQEIDLVLTPRVRDQEMNVTFRYWEGALQVQGTAAGRPVGGRGYAELTGYAEAENRPPS